MRTGIYGEILGAPLEGLLDFLAKLKKEGLIFDQHLEHGRQLMKTHVYFDPVIKELGSVIPPKYLDRFLKLNAPENRRFAFTDDTVLTIATMDAIINLGSLPDPSDPHKNFFTIARESYINWGKKYQGVGFGSDFSAFLSDPKKNQFRSAGNGAAMRIAPLGYLADNASYLRFARSASQVHHGHPEAIRGALCVVDAVAQALKPNATQEGIKEYLEENYFYDLSLPLDGVRMTSLFSVDAARSVPKAILAFCYSQDQESAIFNALSFASDTDTEAMIAGCIADAYYGYENISLTIHKTVEESLPAEMYDILCRFEEKYILKKK